jgi:hypothetical protein
MDVVSVKNGFCACNDSIAPVKRREEKGRDGPDRMAGGYRVVQPKKEKRGFAGRSSLR